MLVLETLCVQATMLNHIIINFMAASNTLDNFAIYFGLYNKVNFIQKGINVTITIPIFQQKTVRIFPSNWMQKFEFGCKPNWTDLTFLLP